MKYVFLVYHDEALLQSMPPGEVDALVDACVANNEVLRANGHLLAVEGVQRSDMATTLRVQNGELVLLDEPVATTHEQLCGIFCIEARDLNHAIYIAANMPQARVGPIEVRALKA